jgi:hypothetical protein
MRVSPLRVLTAVIAVALGVGAAPAFAGCILFSSFDGLTDGGEPDAAADAPDGNATCDSMPLMGCNPIPAAPPGFAPLIDGDPGEFCGLPSIVFNPAKGDYTDCPKPVWLSSDPVSVVIRAAWTADAIHVHVRVNKATPVAPYPDVTQLYKGDAVELYFVTIDAATGTLATDHAVSVIFAPSTDGKKGLRAPGSTFKGSWVTTADGAGYDVEVSIPSTDLGMTKLTSTRVIHWNVGVDVAHPGDDRFQSFLHYQDLDGGVVSCGTMGGPLKPSVDDRSWCRAELQPPP